MGPNKPWFVVIVLLAATVIFALGALQVEPASLDNPTFLELLGLTFTAIGLAIWAAPA